MKKVLASGHNKGYIQKHALHIINKYNLRWSAPRIGIYYNLDPKTVRKILKDSGVELRRRVKGRFEVSNRITQGLRWLKKARKECFWMVDDMRVIDEKRLGRSHG